jgi:hypothetical protein
MPNRTSSRRLVGEQVRPEAHRIKPPAELTRPFDDT